MDSKQRTRFRRKLLHWFDQHGRDLPWRKNVTPYRTWISEIMLQQTQVVTVIDYFERFVERFPDLNSLADAPLEEVLTLWEGLGYYRRARQLHAAAQIICRQHGGVFPTSLDQVRQLPGVGRYTAGAILSIADNQPLPILEGNTQRLFARLLNCTLDPSSKQAQEIFWTFAESIVTRHRPGDLNQALMELGARICTVPTPECENCPVKIWCAALVAGNSESLPRKIKKTKYESIREAAVVICRGDKVVMRRCQEGERWASLWDFPRYLLPKNNHQKFLCQQVNRSTGLSIQLREPLTQLRHVVTRYRITLDCYQAANVRGRISRHAVETQWVTMDQIASHPLSVTGRKIANLITADEAFVDLEHSEIDWKKNEQDRS